MDFEKYTDRSRGFVQSAQSLAQREGHQQFAPEHLLQSAARRPGRARRRADRSRRRQFARGVGRGRSGARQAAESVGRRRRAGLSRSGVWRGCSTPPRRPARRPATALSRSSGCCSRSRSRRTATPERFSANAGVTPQTLNAAIEALRKGRTADFGVGRERL